MPSLIYLMFARYGVSMDDSAGKAGTWHNWDNSTCIAVLLTYIAIGFVVGFAVPIISSARLPATAMSLAEYGAIYMAQHAKNLRSQRT